MAGKRTDGKSHEFVAPAGGVEKDGLYRIGGWNLIAMQDALATETFVGELDNQAVYEVTIPAGLAAAKGAYLSIPTAGGDADDLVADATASSTRILHVLEAKDANNVVWATLVQG